MSERTSRVRPRKAPRVVLGSISAFILLLILPFLLIRIGFVRSWVLERSLEEGLLPPEWTLQIDRVPRIDPWGLRLEGIHLLHETPTEPRHWASLARLEFGWSPTDLLRRKIRATEIGIDSLVIWTDCSPPEITKPERSSEGEKGARESLPWLLLDAFQLDFELRAAGRRQTSGTIALGGVEHRDGDLRASVEQLTITHHPESLTVTVGNGTLTGRIPGHIRLSGAEIFGKGFHGMLDAELFVPPVPPSPLLLADFRLESLLPEQIHLLRRLPIGFAGSDSLGGLLHFEYETAKRFSGRMEVAGRVLEGRLDKLHLLAALSADTLTIHDLGIDHRSGSISSEGRILLDQKRANCTVRLKRVNLADRSLSRWLDGAPRTDFDGLVRAEGRFDSGSIEATARGDLFVRSLLGHSPGPVRFAAGYSDGVVLAESLVVGRVGEMLRAKGAWFPADARFDASADLAGVRLEQWVEPFLGIGIGGSVLGTVRVEGTVESLQVRGVLQCDRFEVAGVRSEDVAIDQIHGTLLPPRIDGHVSATGLDVYGIEFERADFLVDWDETLVVRTEAIEESLRVRAETEIIPIEPGSLLVRNLRLEPGSLAAWSSIGFPRVVWNDGSIFIEDFELRSEDGTMGGRLAIGAGGRSFDGLVQIDSLDLSTVEAILGLPDSALAGQASFHAVLGGTPERISAIAELRSADLVAARWPVGDLSSRIALTEDGTVRVDTLSAGTVPGSGRLTIRDLQMKTGRPLTDFLAGWSDSLASYLEDTRLSGSLAVDGLSLSRLIKTALEAAPGRGRGLFVHRADPMTARIRTVRAGKEGEPLPPAEKFSGSIAFAADLGGTAAAPRVDAHGELIDLQLYQARADSLLYSISYSPGQVFLDSLVWYRGNRASRARGNLPVVLSLVPGATRVLDDRSLALDAELPEIDLGILRVISRDISDPEGFLSGSIALRGTPKRFWPEGSLEIREGGLRIPKREERIRGIHGSLSLDSLGVAIHSLEGRIGEEGRLKGSGTFRSLEDFDLELEVRNATVYETGLYRFAVDGDFRAFPVESPAPGYPLIIGSVDVLEGAIVGDLAKAPPPPSGASSGPSPWQAEIDVYAPGNVRLQTTVASVDMGEADNLHVSFDDPEINVSGGIRVLGGHYRVFNNIFRITSGVVEFRDTGTGLVEPILDVRAETRVTEQVASAEQRQRTIDIHVTGPVTALNLDFSSGDMATDEIIELLSYGRFRDPASGELAYVDPSRDLLITEVVAQIEAEMSQLIAPLQNVSVRPGDEPGGAWQLNVRQTLLPQMSLAYTRELTSAPGQEISVQYNLQGQLYLNAAVERRQEEGPPSDRYSLDLKMRFEYK